MKSMYVNKTAGRVIAVLSALLMGLCGLFAPVHAAGYGIKCESRTEDSIKLSWDEQKGADGYRVYKYDDAAGKYVVYKTIVTSFCTVSDLKPDTSYKFRIRSLTKNEKGKYVKLSDSGSVTVKTKAKAVEKPAPVKEEKEETFEQEVERLKKELSEAKRELSSLESEINSCQKKIDSYKKIVETKHITDNSTTKEIEEIMTTKENLVIEEDRLRDLTNQRSVLKATVNRLTTTLNSMGIKTR